MTTYALIAKYKGAPAVYIRHATEDGLSESERCAEQLDSYAVARKLVEREDYVLVKSWKDAEARADADSLAETMQPEHPLTWKNKVNGWHRAKTADGTYNIRRWFLINNEWVPGPANGAAVGATDDRMWRISFERTDGEVEDVPWWKPESELLHSLDHAKTSCQHHANARTLSLV